MKLRKIGNYLLSTSLAITGITVVTTLSSCKKTNKENEFQILYITPNTLSETNKKFLLNLSVDEWASKLRNNLDSDTETLISIINEQNKTYLEPKNCSFYNFQKLYNTDSIVKTTLTCTLSFKNNYYKLVLKNIFTFSNKYFYPPKQTTLEFSQTDMEKIKNTPYQEVLDYQWLDAINNLYFQNNSNSNEFPIPPSLYLLSNKTYDSINKEYVLTFSINSQYMEQIEILPNSEMYVDISVKITNLVVE